jgi:phosphoribosylformylglycinamidine synthase
LGVVEACHDLSEGGLAVAAAEMVIASEVGLEVEVWGTGLRPDWFLFSESNSRFLVEVREGKEEEFEGLLKSGGCKYRKVGRVTEEAELRIVNGGEELARIGADELRRAWRSLRY